MVTSGNSKLSIPTFIPLAEAVRKYNLTEDVLTRLIQDGRIDAAQLPSGELLVSDKDLYQAKTKEEVIEERFRSLQGQPITVSQAAEKYELAAPTIRKWIDRGYIRKVSDSEYPMKIDEADVAYCKWAYHKQDGRPGMRIFDEQGQLYELKHPELAEYRRVKRKRKR